MTFDSTSCKFIKVKLVSMQDKFLICLRYHPKLLPQSQNISNSNFVQKYKVLEGYDKIK
jgi:hypothetical protein